MPASSIAEVDEDPLNNELQMEELLALSSIFGQSFMYNRQRSVTGAEVISGILSVNTEIPDDTVEIILDQENIRLHYLPPIIIEFTMIPRYPLQDVCKFSIQSVWLNKEQLNLLKSKLREIWETEKNVILYHFADFLQHDTLNCLDITFPLELENVTCSGGVPLKKILQQHEISCLQETFIHTSYTCSICMEEKKGDSCTQLSRCGHVFCKVCLTGYFSMLIREGMVYQVRCPDLECSAKKEDENEPPSQEELILIVGEDLANRYDRLQLQLKLQADPSITFCPRLQCQQPVRKDENYEKLCFCTHCGYAFCLLCQKTWHGKQVYCQFKDKSAILQQYLDCEDDPEALRKLEGKYGKKNLDKMINDHKIEMETEKWKKENTVQCPTCHISVEKTFGCNHMTCQICQTHFCFLCGSWVDPNHPYKHFNFQGNLCYMRLFEGAGDVYDIDVLDD
ncbi:hypothetical protein BGW37DRAFT_515065 [Umbelopsis sp. PMI_123]|nr:hypothetical protein BGW37DRAFT_515065 [Umbelopsis sp. PMI_123]